MMRFSICHFGEFVWLELKRDIILSLRQALLSGGYEVTLRCNSLSASDMNLLVGHDLLAPDTWKQIRAFKDRYILVDFEEFDGRTINNRPDFPLQSYLALCRNARGILSIHKATIDGHCNAGFADRSRYFRWGTSRYISEHVNIATDSAKQYDFIFFGMLKGNRARTIDALRKTSRSVCVIEHPGYPNYLRDEYIARSRFGLNLSAFPSVNPIRTGLFLQNGIPVFTDVSDNDKDGYNTWCASFDGNNISSLTEKIESGNWWGDRQDFFSESLDANFCQALDSVLSRP